MGKQIKPPGYHVAKQGDWLSKLAIWYGITKWETIWEDGNNSELRNLRGDPNILLPGDKVWIPEPQPKIESCATGATHQFKMHRAMTELRLVVKDSEGQPYADSPYTLVLDQSTYTGTTESDGGVTQKILPDAQGGTLTLDNNGYRFELRLAHLDPVDTVTGIQARLNNLGYKSGPVDGIVGPKTRAATRAFQADNPPLAVDGIAGPKTQAKLKEVYGC